MTNAAEARKVLKWFTVKHKEGHPECPACGHGVEAHTTKPNEPGKGVRVVCPDVPPAKTEGFRSYNEAEGRTHFDGTGFTTPPAKPNLADEIAAADEERTKTAERKRLALVNFDRRPVFIERRNIALSQLTPMINNPRGEFSDADVDDLRRSIENTTFIGSLIVRELPDSDMFEVIIGNRRLRAAQLAGLTEVPCEVYELSDGQALEMNLAEQINRNDLTPLKEGESCRKLMELQGYDEQQVAEKFGRSSSWVTKRVALSGMAPELKKALTKGELPLTTALALAALTTHQQQIKALDEIEHMIDGGYSAEDQVASIRANVCRPLADASWKLTDADLVPEAGPCSTCPKNSQNNKQPGLYDNAKAKPTCSDTPCFDDKELAEWLRRTAKLKAAGAKVLSLAESRKVFGRGNDLASDSRYVDSTTKAAKDKQGRTWGELAADIEKDERPQLHVAQDNNGKLRELYVADKLLEGIATHLKLRWAKNVVEEAEEQRTERTPEARAKKDAEIAEQALIRKVREDVTEATVLRIAAKFAAPGKFPVAAARFLASGVGGRALERFTEATGRKLRKDWLEKEATIEEALTIMWIGEATDHLSPHSDGLHEELVRLAKVHGIDVDAAIQAQLATAKREASK